jgi:hypothetical protein
LAGWRVRKSPDRNQKGASINGCSLLISEVVSSGSAPEMHSKPGGRGGIHS